jgi:YcxB-like protein
VDKATSVEVSFTLDRAEFVRGPRPNWLRSPSFYWLPVAGALALLVGLLTSKGLSSTIGIGWLLVAAGMFIVVPATRWERNKRAQAIQLHRFTSEAVFVEFLDSESRVAWSYFTDAFEATTEYVVRHQRLACNVIPKQAFNSKGDEETFRQLVSSHVNSSFHLS